MTKLLVWLVAFASLPVGARAAPWPMAGGDPKHTGRAPVPLPAQANLVWHVPVGRFGFAGVIVGRVAGEDVVFGVSHDWEYGEKAYAVRRTGDVMWETTIPDEPGADATPFLDEASGVLYVPAQDNSITAIQADTGVVLWKKSYPSAGTGQFTTSGPTPGPGDTFYLLQDTLLLGDRAGLVAIHLDGTLAWTKDLGPYSHGQGSVAVDDGGNLVVLTTYALEGFMPAGRVFQVTPDGATTLWDYRHPDPFPFFGTPAVDDDGGVYFGAQGQVGDWIGALDSDAHLKWENWEVSSHASPALGPDFIAILDDTGHLAVLDKKTGVLRFRVFVGEGVDRNRAQPVVDRCGRIAAASTGGRLVLVGPDAEVLWEQTFEGQALAGPAVGSDGTLYVRAYGLFAFAGPPAPDCSIQPADGPADEASSPDIAGDTGGDAAVADPEPVIVEFVEHDGEGVESLPEVPARDAAGDPDASDPGGGIADVPEVAITDPGPVEPEPDPSSGPDNPPAHGGSGGGCSSGGAAPPAWPVLCIAFLAVLRVSSGRRRPTCRARWTGAWKRKR